MKSILCLTALAALVAAPLARACDRVAEIHNVRVAAGPVRVAIYGDAASFRKTPIGAFKLAADRATLGLPLCNFGDAELALIAYQDLNQNDGLDLDLFGLPTEPWGASGQPTPMGPPTWASASVRPGAAVAVVLSR